ncbi:MAG TPA: VOC family protein [Gaiellaceae bacterium]|nr:VOC family protein [Gaiellaceae bacterium]
MDVQKVDFVLIPSRDPAVTKRFYGETLGLRPDEHAHGDAWFEFWAGETCLGFFVPESMGREFAPTKNGPIALRVPDVAAARAELEANGVEFAAETIDSGVCTMAFFTDPDGNDLMLHNRYAPHAH